MIGSSVAFFGMKPSLVVRAYRNRQGGHLVVLANRQAAIVPPLRWMKPVPLQRGEAARILREFQGKGELTRLHSRNRGRRLGYSPGNI